MLVGTLATTCALEVAAGTGLWLGQPWWVVAFVVLLAFGPLTVAAPALRSLTRVERARARLLRDPTLFLAQRQRLVVLTGSLGPVEPRLPLDQEHALWSALPAPWSVADFDVWGRDLPDDRARSIQASADLVVLTAARGFNGSDADTLALLMPVAALLEGRARNGFRQYLLLRERSAQSSDRAPTIWRFDVDGHRVQAIIASATWDEGGRMACPELGRIVLGLRSVRDVGLLGLCGPRQVGLLLDELPQDDVELLTEGLLSASHADAAHALLDVWDACLRRIFVSVAACWPAWRSALRATESANVIIGMDQMLRVVSAPDLPLALEPLRTWLTNPLWKRDELQTSQLVESVIHTQLRATDAAGDRLSPYDLAHGVRLLRNAIRHGTMTYGVGKGLRAGLLADLLCWHTAAKGTFRPVWADPSPQALPTITWYQGDQPVAVGSAAELAKEREGRWLMVSRLRRGVAVIGSGGRS